MSEAVCLLNFAGDTISGGSGCLWEPHWSWAGSRLLWNLGVTQGDFPCGWPGFCGYLLFKISLIQGTYEESRVKTIGGFAFGCPYDTIPWATPAHRRGPPESPCGLEKADHEQGSFFSPYCYLILVLSAPRLAPRYPERGQES